MRIVLIIQSLIILAGAYYVYTLTRTPAEEIDDGSSSNINIEVRREEETSTVQSADEEEVTGNTGEGNFVDGANDLGMEFPMPVEDEVPESR
jgi:hypothetical protein